VTPQRFRDFEAFASWGNGPREWGPDTAWRVWFGGDVLAGLVQVIDERVATRKKGRRYGTDVGSATIGCVPWLTDRTIAGHLAALDVCCVVVDKGHELIAPELVTAENTFPNVLRGLKSRAPAEAPGRPLVLGPTSQEIQYGVGRYEWWAGSATSGSLCSMPSSWSSVGQFGKSVTLGSMASTRRSLCASSRNRFGVAVQTGPLQHPAILRWVCGVMIHNFVSMLQIS
jgi:hypothetical protein